VPESACMSSVSMDKSYAVRFNDLNTCTHHGGRREPNSVNKRDTAPSAATCTHLGEREKAAVAINDNLVRRDPQLVLDEPQEVLLIHARGVMYVRIDLWHVDAAPRQNVIHTTRNCCELETTWPPPSQRTFRTL
jgi:hypothetical protein